MPVLLRVRVKRVRQGVLPRRGQVDVLENDDAVLVEELLDAAMGATRKGNRPETREKTGERRREVRPRKVVSNHPSASQRSGVCIDAHGKLLLRQPVDVLDALDDHSELLVAKSLADVSA